MTLYRRKRIWWSEFEVAGQVHQRSTGETSKIKALRIEQRLISDRYDVKTLSRLYDMKLGEAINRYLETVLLKKPRNPDSSLRPSTKIIVNYLRLIEKHFGRKTPLAYLCRPGVIAEYNQTLLLSVKPISANKYLTYLRAVLNRAYDWGALEYRPPVKLNSVRWSRSRFLSSMEERRLVAVCPERIRALVEFILDTGARKEEALTLRWGQVTLRRKPRAVVTFVDTKNGDSRVVPLPKRSARNLRHLARSRRSERDIVFRYPASRDLYHNNGDGLYARKGQLVPISTMQKTWESARAKAGLSDCRLHDLRHTYASRLVRAGVPIFYVARLLGHKTIGMTMRYSHLAPLDLDRAVSVLD
jgi:integrase